MGVHYITGKNKANKDEEKPSMEKQGNKDKAEEGQVSPAEFYLDKLKQGVLLDERGEFAGVPATGLWSGPNWRYCYGGVMQGGLGVLAAVVYGEIWFATNPPYGLFKNGVYWKQLPSKWFRTVRVHGVSKYLLRQALWDLQRAGLIFIFQGLDRSEPGNPNWYAINPEIPKKFIQIPEDMTDFIQ